MQSLKFHQLVEEKSKLPYDKGKIFCDGAVNEYITASDFQ